MQGLFSFAKTTALGGLVFLLPLLVVAYLLVQAYEIMLEVAEPLARVLPVEALGGIAWAGVLAALLLVLLCFLVGLLARTALARRLRQGFERRVVAGVPFYGFVKSMLSSSLPAEEEGGLRPVLVRFDDCSQIAFEVERPRPGEVAVFLPGAPNPWSGKVQLVAAARVQPLDAGMMGTVATIQQLGLGTGALLARSAAAAPPPP